MTRRRSQAVLAAALAASSGCVLGCVGVEEDLAGRAHGHLVTPNVEVSVLETTHPGSTDKGLQSEQSMVRSVLPGGGRALVVGYNDTTHMVDEDPDGEKNQLVEPFSFMGWSISYDDGLTWSPQPQLPPPPRASSG